ncbi:hypothetical protein FQA39_LY05846 [Lamprigera yunnana]|nr:hypothetical protein FQA39_LY05846 [Lamprigera yunnana]
MESKSNKEKVTPATPHNILLERASQSKHCYFNSDSPFRLLPSISTPPSRLLKIKNPFESQLVERLHQSTFSPSVFKMQKTKTEEKFKWSIEEISVLNPADIDEATVEQFECDNQDLEAESTAQAYIESYFSEKHIVPSPFNVAVNNVPLIPENDKQKGFKQVADGIAQTVLTMPPKLPDHIENILKPFFTYTEEQQQNESNRNSLYRRLFDFTDEPFSDSILSSPAPSCTLSPIELSPCIESKIMPLRSFGSPHPNEIADCTLSPIISNNEVSENSIIVPKILEDMNVDTSLNLVPDTLDQMPSHNYSLGFESMHLPDEEILSTSDVCWDLEYKHVSLESSKEDILESEMDVSNSNTPKSKIFISQRKKLSDSFLKMEESDKENVFVTTSFFERRSAKCFDNTADVGYHTDSGLFIPEESWASSQLYASTPTKIKK